MMSCRAGIFLFAGALLALGGCDRGAQAPDPAAPGSPRLAGPYFDVRGLLDAQIRQLTASQPAITKHVALRNDTPETVQVPRVKWADELQIFYQADINKPALRGAYRLDSTMEAGGATRRTYTAQPGHPNASVTRLSVLSTGGQPQEIEATLRQDNVLFSSQKQLRLTLQQGQLRAYSVRGSQKLVFFDTLRYQTRAQVR
jgi:hypothetical protein